jgi:hypothetical protein
MIGIVMGLIILVAIFLLPFGDGSSTLYGTTSSIINNLRTVQSGGNSPTLVNDYTWIAAFALLVISGLVGVFPFGSGAAGMVGMAVITISPYLIYPNGQHPLPTGAGFYVAWVASAVNLVASEIQGKKETQSPGIQAPSIAA